MVFLKDYFKKVDFEKMKHEKISSRQRMMHDTLNDNRIEGSNCYTMVMKSG